MKEIELIKEVLAGKPETEIASDCGKPIDRHFQIPVNHSQEEGKHPEFHTKPLEKEPDY